MIKCQCQSDLFYFTYRFFGSCLEYGNTLFMISFDNPVLLNVSNTFSRYLYGFSLFFYLRFILFFIIILLVDLIGLIIMEVSEYKSQLYSMFFYEEQRLQFRLYSNFCAVYSCISTFLFEQWFLSTTCSGYKYVSTMYYKVFFYDLCTIVFVVDGLFDEE